MRFEILNVEHGFCAYAVGSDGGVLLFDCGHSSANRPSAYLPARGIKSIRRFFVTNYDEDHISDLVAVRQNLYLEVLTRNASMTSGQVRSLKSPPISPAMNELLGMIDSYTGEVAPHQLEPNGIQVWFFHNDYPVFSDTNNLSLLTFFDVGDVSFVLGGDLERPGWLELLCAEVFNYCKPRLIVMSDGSVEHDTQLMSGKYSRHASGELFTTPSGQQIRKVVTTRNDGNIYWNL